MKKRFAILFISLILPCVLFADAHQIARRNIWEPQFQGQNLAYCTANGDACGLPVATRYCRLLGYDKASHQVVSMNAGLTHYIDTKARCVGWRCPGFKNITCIRDARDETVLPAHYRNRRFDFPRYNHYRVDYCYDGTSGCGKRAAQSFCRRLGYMRTTGFVSDPHIRATSAIGNQKLCFRDCTAFKQIDCFR